MYLNHTGILENPIALLCILFCICFGLYIAVSSFGSLSYVLIPQQTATGWEGGIGGSNEMNQSLANAENAAITVFNLGSIAPIAIAGFGVLAVLGAIWASGR